MNGRKFRGIVGASICVLGFGSVAYTQQIDLNSGRTEQGFTLDLSQARQTDFFVKLRIPNTPDAIKEAVIFDLEGREIQFRVLLAEGEEWILGTHLPGITFEILHRPEDNSFVVIGRDANGNLVELSRDDLFLTGTRFNQQCFDFAKVDGTSLPLRVHIALDISGSMDGVLLTLKFNLRNFLSRTPSHAQCQIAVFDGDVRYLSTNGGVGNREPAPATCQSFIGGLDGSDLGARSGGTNIIKALTPIYRRSLKAPDESHLALVISDGVGRNEAGSRAFRRLQRTAAQAVEDAGIYTIVNWLGSFDQNYPLASLADQSIIGTQGGQIGQAFFDGSLRLVSAQRQLTVTACDP